MTCNHWNIHVPEVTRSDSGGRGKGKGKRKVKGRGKDKELVFTVDIITGCRVMIKATELRKFYKKLHIPDLIVRAER
jgi:hypothetical protein